MDMTASPSVLDRPLHVTIWHSVTAKKDHGRQTTMRKLADRIRHHRGREKAALPLLKLSNFGNLATDAGTLRHDANLLAMEGLEIDYDGGEITLDEAAEVLLKGNVAAVLYSSPSSTAERPKWRLLLPTSRPLEQSYRDQLLGFVAGLFFVHYGADVFDGASWTASQSFYFGSVVGNEQHHRVELIDGEAVDQAARRRPEIWRPKPGYVATPADPGAGSPAGATNGASRPDIAAARQAIRRGTNFHDAMKTLAGSLFGRGHSRDAVGAELLAELDAVPPEQRDGRWQRRRSPKHIAGLLGWFEKRENQKQARAGREAPEDEHGDAAGAGDEAKEPALTLDDFVAHLPDHKYIHMPTGNSWPGVSVDAVLPKVSGVGTKEIKATRWLDRHRRVEQMAWLPGEPALVRDRLFVDGGVIDRPGATVFNLYRRPQPPRGDATLAGPWLDHVRLIYPDDGPHIVAFLAHRVQRPGEKINHALVLGGSPGIGKDTLVEPVTHAVGPWNVRDVAPARLLGQFNPHVKSVILRISEARDLGEINRYDFYEHCKTLLAAPPDYLCCNEKNRPEYAVSNICGVVFTTNYKTNGLYLPADDRRHYVAWSNLTTADLPEGYFAGLWAWLEKAGGHGHIAAYLRQYDLSGFDAKAPPRKTPAFYEIAAANGGEESELRDVLDALAGSQNTDVVTIAQLAAQARKSGNDALSEWLNDRKNRRMIPAELEKVGYAKVPNPHAEDGLWSIKGKRLAIYARKVLPKAEALRRAADLARQ